MARALITGVGGFAGSHLADVISRETDWDLCGIVLGPEDTRWIPASVSIVQSDLREPGQARVAIEHSRPDYIFHLAAQGYVPQSWKDPWHTYETNIRSQFNLFHAVSAIGISPKILVVGSNEEYGWAGEQNLPITERTTLRPQNPYAVSKITQDFMGLQYFLHLGLQVIRVRPFNHIGPRQEERFVAPSFAKQIVEIERGLRPPVLKLGNMSARRDFTDVRDMCRAYVLSLQKGIPGEVYNIGSGCARSMRELLDLMLSHSSIEPVEETDPSKMRPSDVPVSFCDPSKFRQHTGWEPRIPLEQTVVDILEDWRNRQFGT